MLVDGKWTDAWQPVQATDAKGGFVRQASSFRSWVTPDGAAGPTGEARLSRREGALPSLRRLDLPVGDPGPDRPQAEAARGRRLGLDRRAGDDGPGLAIRRLSRRDPRCGQRRDLSARDLYAGRPALHRPRDRAGAVGQGARHDRQQRIVRTSQDVQLGLRRARRRAARPLSARPAVLDRPRSTTRSTPRSTTASIAPASPPPRPPTRRPSPTSSPCSTSWRSASPSAAIFSASS